jgi:hypothetical protein
MARKIIISAAALTLYAFVGLLGAALLWEAVDDYRFDARHVIAAHYADDGSTMRPAFLSVRQKPDRRIGVYLDRSLTRTETVDVAEEFDNCALRVPDLPDQTEGGDGIVLLGESIASGAEVPYAEGLAARLARSLSVPITNFAVPGSNSSEYAAIARAAMSCRGLKNFAAAVIGLFTDPFIGDVSRRLAVEKNGQRVLYNNTTMSSSRALHLSQSTLSRWRFRMELLARAYSSTFNRLFPPHPSVDFAIPIAERMSPEEYDRYAQEIVGSLDEISGVIGVPHQRVVAWLESSAGELTELSAAKRRNRESAPRVHESRNLWNAVIARLRESGYAVADPRELVANSYLSGGIYPFSTSGHYRPIAYEITAPIIANALAKALASTQ